jgi:cytoskeletal protein CcmA (bactofilin family)
LALFEKKPPAASEVPARRFTDAAPDAGTVLGSLRIKGELRGGDSVALGGSFEGTLETEGVLRIEKGARVRGRLEARDVVIEGHVEARVTARGKVEMGAAAHVRGDVDAGRVAIADGCFFDGRVHMREEGAGIRPQSFKEKRRQVPAAEPAPAPPSAPAPAPGPAPPAAAEPAASGTQPGPAQ